MIYTHVLNNAGGRGVRSALETLCPIASGPNHPSAYPNRSRLTANPANTAASMTRPKPEINEGAAR
jgi:hypothetical protein